MMHSEDEKLAFYEDLYRLVRDVPHNFDLILWDDFNQRVGQEQQHWPKVLGHNSVGKRN